jgi:tRNA pseudouridine38-40 synthase
MRLALIIEYEGTCYHGFQYQANAPSIQEELEKAIASLTGEKVRVKGAGRTDAGVHASGQVIAFDTASTHSSQTFMRALNYYLPKDIAVRAAYRVRYDFDPRREALSRTYRYTILNSPTPSPLMRRIACVIGETLNIRRIQAAARLLIGEHDFRQFAGSLERESASTVRRIYEVSLVRKGQVLTFEVRGSAFLPHQVRRMAGALVDIGKGKLSLEELKQMIDGGRVNAVAHSLPPQGLCLVQVAYADFPPEDGEF